MKKSDSITTELNRRDFLLTAIGACAVVPVLSGCGGGGSSSGSASTRSFTGTVTLPAGVSSTNLSVVAGQGESPIANSSFSVSASSVFPTLVTVVDTSSGKVILLGMLDPKASAQAINAASCAAALLFVSVGGSQIPGTGRAQLLAAITTNTVTATLAAVIKTQLDIDEFALQNGNSSIATALATAISGTTARSAKSKATVPGELNGSAGRVATTRAAVSTFSVAGNVQEGSYVAKFQIDGSTEPVIAINNTLRETQLSMFYVGSSDLSGVRTDLTTAASVFSDQSIPRSSAVDDQGNLTFGQYPFTVAPHTTDGSKNADFFGLVRITPIFDNPDPAFFADTRYIGYVSTWRSALQDMYERALAQVVSQYIIEALGFGCITDNTLINQAVTNLGQIGSAELGFLQTARTGTGLNAGTLGCLLNATASDTGAQAYITAVTDAFKITLNKSRTNTLLNLRGTILLFRALGVLDESILLGELTASLNEKTDSFGATVASGFLNEASYNFNSVIISPLNTQYVPGGPTITISIQSIYSDSAYTLHWKFSGLNATITDNSGHAGTDFTSHDTAVVLTTTPSTTGTITVSCDVILNTSNQVIGTATSTLTPTPTGQTGGVTVNAVQQTGIDASIGAWTLYGGLNEYSYTIPGGGNGYKLDLGFGQTVFGKYPGSSTVAPGTFNYSTGNTALAVNTTTAGTNKYLVGTTITIPANGVSIGSLTNHDPAQMMITSVNGSVYGFSIMCTLNNNFDPTFSNDATFALQVSGSFNI